MLRWAIVGFVAVVTMSAARAGDDSPAPDKSKAPAARGKGLRGQMDPERMVQFMLRRMDTNKDGKISKDEAKGPLAKRFDQFDTNQDGYLDKDELLKLAQRLAERPKKPGKKGTPAAAAASPEVQQMVSQMLDRLDTNKDGKISRDEAKGPLAERFDQVDTNKDGFLDKEELTRAALRMAAFRKANPGGGGPAVRPNTPDFDALDKDADGRLTRDELKGNSLADHFDEIDTNKDGKIDRKEFDAYFQKQAEKKPAGGKAAPK